MMALTMGINAQTRYAEHSRLASGKWVKIRVKNEGVYQLTASALKNMGFNHPEKVCLYGYNLPLLPETHIESLDDDVTEMPLYRKTDGTMLFYSCGTTEWTRNNSSAYTHKNNPYSNYVYYFLTETTGTPAAFNKAENQASPSSSVQSTYYAHTLYEEDAYSFLNTGRTFFERYDYSSGNTKTYDLSFDNSCAGDITLEVKFGAAGNSASTLSVTAGDNSLGTLAFSSLSNYQYASVSSKSFILYDQTASLLKVKLQHTRASGISGHLDYILASYPALLAVTAKNFVTFQSTSSYTASKRYSIQNANSATSVWNVTSPAATCELAGELSGSTYTAFAPQAEDTDKFVAVNTAATFPSPEVVGTTANQDLHALDSINLVIIVPANGKWIDQAQRLADAHTEKEGIRCVVVTADQVYNEFSSGTPDATAYRRFMKMLYDKQFETSPLTGTQKGGLNLLLFGPCMWDNRFVTTGMSTKSQDDYLLVYESDNSWSHTDSYVMEEYFTLLADGKGVSPLKEKPDCGVGRIPVSTAAEAKNVVDKLIGYINNENAGAWKNTICIMGDDGDNNIHASDAETVLSNTESLFPNFNYKRIYWDTYTREQSATGNGYPGVYADINKMMQDGALIMNYTGHGAAYCLSHEQVLKTADFQNWSSERLPLWLTAACDVAPFDMNTENIACEAILNKKGAAMGVISTARTVYSSPNRILNTHFMSHVLATKNNGERYTLGEALAQAKADILASKTYYTKQDTINKVHFVLIGDPAIQLAIPTYRVIVDKVNGNSSSTTTTISAKETATIEGHIADEDGNPVNNFNGVISPIIYDSKEHVVGKNNAGQDVDPIEYDDHIRVLYTGTDSVTNGQFRFSFPVPLDINYSNESGLMIFHAINNEKTIEANGRFEEFLVGGTSNEEQTDTIGPNITAYLNSSSFKDGSATDETPTLYVSLYDDSGINTTGNGLGHDIEAIIDNNEATIYRLNDYYTPSIGDYRSGTITYTLPTLTAGKHTMVIRAFDTLNNVGETTINFEVVEGLVKKYDIFDLSGRQLLNTDGGASLPKGVYIRRVRLTSPTGTVSSSSEKFIVTQ